MPVSGSIRRVGDEDYERLLADETGPLVLCIGAAWCQDCRRIAPLFVEFARRYAGRVVFAEADFDHCSQMRERFEVRHIPSIFLLRDGQVVDRLIEPKTIAAFRDFIEGALGFPVGPAGD